MNDSLPDLQFFPFLRRRVRTSTEISYGLTDLT